MPFDALEPPCRTPAWSGACPRGGDPRTCPTAPASLLWSFRRADHRRSNGSGEPAWSRCCRCGGTREESIDSARWTDPPDLQALREALERVDAELLDLLRRRMALAEGWRRPSSTSAWPFRDAAREDRMLVHLRQLAVEKGLDAHEVERLFRVVLDMSVARQEAHVRAPATTRRCASPTRAPRGATATSPRRATSPASRGACCSRGTRPSAAAAEAVRTGAADLALLPIENTTAGSINETYDLLSEGGLVITGEVVRAVEHCLLALPGATLDGAGGGALPSAGAAPVRGLLPRASGHPRRRPSTTPPAPRARCAMPAIARSRRSPAPRRRRPTGS